MIKAKDAYLIAEAKRKDANVSNRERMKPNLDIVYNYVVIAAENGNTYCNINRQDLSIFDNDIGTLCSLLEEDGYNVVYNQLCGLDIIWENAR
jgi:hypothetical protein